jgi:hypothetical protein
MTRLPDRLELRIAPGTPADVIVAPLVTAMGARAGLGVDALDELQMASDLLLAGARDADVLVTLSVAAGELLVTIRPVAEERLRTRGGLVTQLAGGVRVEGDSVELRVGA